MLSLEFLEEPPIDTEKNSRRSKKDNVRLLRIPDRMTDAVEKDLLILNLEGDFVVVKPTAVAVQRNGPKVVLAGRVDPPKDQHEEERKGDRESRPVSSNFPAGKNLWPNRRAANMRLHRGVSDRHAFQLA